MADSATTKAASAEVITSVDDVVRVKDLASPHTNPNIPRSIFAPALSAAAADADSYISVRDGFDQPGEGFKAKSLSGKAIQMNTGFDANGQTGNAGDWLVYAGGHWFVAKEV